MADGPAELETGRLILRQWSDSDRDAFATMNADPGVMRYFPAPLSRTKSDALLERMREAWRRDGISFWAVELKGGGLIGFCGLNRTSFPPHMATCIEIGWRLAPNAWGKGYATEAARASLDNGFGAMGLDEVVAFCVAGNERLRAVMERLGMTRNPADDFDDPDAAVDSPLRPLVLYRLRREKWNP